MLASYCYADPQNRDNKCRYTYKNKLLLLQKGGFFFSHL